MLVALAERMAERPVLVTFNGKSFDWPLLETRYRMTRKIRVPELRAHLDFLHPGAESVAAAAGFGAAGGTREARAGLESRDGRDVGVDSVALLRFSARRPAGAAACRFSITIRWICAGWPGYRRECCRCSANAESQSADAFELFGVSRICERRGESARARALFQRSIEGELPAETERDRATLAGADGEARRRFRASASAVGKSAREIRAKGLKRTSSWRFITSVMRESLWRPHR